ncbi:MAG TPA: alkaline phosphatase family protein, partial [Gemmatimonadaceae bacterium]
MKKSILSLYLAVLAICYVVSNVQTLKASRGDKSPAPANLGTPRQSDRVVLIVLDGVPVRVGYDRDIMPFLGELAAEGASGVLRAPEETTTPAGVRALATGQTPSAADVLDMFRESEYTGWTVYDDVIKRGETVALSGDQAWTSLLASRDPAGVKVTSTETRLYQNAELVLANAARRLESQNPPRITVVHLSETDRLGHLYGTRSSQYKTRMRAIDGQIRSFVKRVIPANATLLITADHGNDVFGSHGGEADVYRNVPIIMSGQGIRKGAKITMDGRAMPGVLGVLLGTRIPAEMQAVIPVQAFALNSTDAATVVKANAQQLQQLVRIRGLVLPASITGLFDRIGRIDVAAQSDSAAALASGQLATAVSALDLASPPSVPRIVWALLLIFALLVVGGEALWPSSGPNGSVGTALWTASALLVAALIWPAFSLPILAVVLAIEVGLVLTRLVRGRSLAMLFAFLLPILVVLLAAARFAYMPQIKALLHMPAGRVVALLIVALAVAGFVAMRRNGTIGRSTQTEGLLVGVCLLGIAFLVPFPPIPALLLVASVASLRAAGASWQRLVWIAAGLAAFFFLSERVAFAYTGEARVARYAYVGLSSAVLAGALSLRAGAYRRELILAWAFLVPIWPFGYVKIADSDPSAVMAALLVVVPLLVAAWVASSRVRVWWAYLPLIGAIAYQLHRTHPFFWIAMATHLGVLAAVALSSDSDGLRARIMALTATSGLILMSAPGLAPTIVLLGLGLVAATSLDTGRFSSAAAVLIGAALLVFSRYA